MKKNLYAKAITYFRQGLMAYPNKAREQHFLDVIETILFMNPKAETDAACIAKHGLEALGIDASQQHIVIKAGKALLNKFKELELRCKGFVARSPSIGEILDSYAEPVGFAATRIVENNPGPKH